MGIEGIDARDGYEYLHCETPEEYENTIRKIFIGDIDAEEIAKKAICMMDKNYDLKKSFGDYRERVYSLCEERKRVREK